MSVVASTQPNTLNLPRKSQSAHTSQKALNRRHHYATDRKEHGMMTSESIGKDFHLKGKEAARDQIFSRPHQLGSTIKTSGQTLPHTQELGRLCIKTDTQNQFLIQYNLVMQFTIIGEKMLEYNQLIMIRKRVHCQSEL